MSLSLIRRGLDLYKDDIKAKDSTGRKVQVSDEGLTREKGKNDSAKRKRLNETPQGRVTLKAKKVKQTQEIYKKYTKHDMTEANLKALNFIKLLNQDETKIMEKAAEHFEKKIKHKPTKPKVTDTSEEQTSAFTEEDFEKFFKEYKFT